VFQLGLLLGSRRCSVFEINREFQCGNAVLICLDPDVEPYLSRNIMKHCQILSVERKVIQCLNCAGCFIEAFSDDYILREDISCASELSSGILYIFIH